MAHGAPEAVPLFAGCSVQRAEIYGQALGGSGHGRQKADTTGSAGEQMIEVSSLLEPVAGDAPTGPNMEYDAAFGELERVAQGKPEQQVGNTIVPGEEPDWREVERQAVALLGQTKDLRVAMHLTRALLRSAGYPGFAQGVELLRGYVDQYWEQVHPQLDPDDDYDATMRMNILGGLCDSATFLSWVRLTPLVTAKALGRYTLRDVLVATGEMKLPPPPPGDKTKPPDTKSIDAAFRGSEPAELTVTLRGARAARKSVAEIENIVTDKVGVGNAVNLSALRNVLDQAIKVLEKHAPPEPVEQEAAEEVSVESGDTAAPAGEAAPARGPKRLEGEISSREEVLLAIDKICAYYDKYEPSSPLPIMLGRCKRLVSKDFLSIIRELAPESEKQIELLRGRSQE